MHILLVNDDGPPDPASPFILSFVRALESAGHLVSIVVPDSQRSWIGKAHLISTPTVTHPYWPPDVPAASRTANNAWYTVSSTPAACTHLGLHHLFTDRPPFDLVLSGPNYGTNITTLFAMSSGTLGAAMEGALCRHKAIGLSFAYFAPITPEHVVEQACRFSVKLVESLVARDDWDVNRCYSIVVPLEDGPAKEKAYWCRMKNVQFKPSSSAYCETTAEGGEIESADDSRLAARSFVWRPDLAFNLKVRDYPQEEGTDSWATANGYTAVIPLNVNFSHVEGLNGQLNVDL